MPGSLLVVRGRVLTPKGWVAGDVVVEGGQITRVGRAGKAKADAVIDAAGARVVPGLIDMQINGAFGKTFASATAGDIVEIARGLARLGVTGFLASYVSLPMAALVEALTRLREATHDNIGAEILGAHLEGPYLSAEKAGAHRRENIRPPNMVEFTRMVSAGDGIARMMTLAPETRGAASIIAAGVKRGMVMALGHSQAGESEVEEALRAGATVATHLFNAMPPMHHREVNLTSMALTDDRLACTCIYDRVHVNRAALRAALRCKPAGRLALVSDATAALEAPDGGFEADGVRYAVRNRRVTISGTDTLAGSAAPLIAGVHHVVEDGGLPFEDAWRLASAAPAAMLGLAGKGELAPGRDGDLVVLEDDGTARATAVRGTLVHGSRSQD